MTDKEVLATGSVYQLSGNRGMAASQASTNTASMYNASDEWMGSYTSSSTTSSQSANQEYSNQGSSNCQWGQNCCCCARRAYQQGLREGYRPDGALVVVKIAANVAVETTRLEMTSDFN